MSSIGITERGDAALNTNWEGWVREGRPAILITKDPEKLYKILITHFIEPPNIIVHCTITGHGGTVYEPNVPSPDHSFRGYHHLIKYLGKDRVVLRVDPIIVTDYGIQIAKEIISHAETRVRISFLDIYPHVRERFEKHGIHLWNEFHAPLNDRRAAWETLGRPEICGEPGFECNGCVSEIDCNILGVTPSKNRGFQRESCACLGNKRELFMSRERCPHGCLYCYWKDE
ncbi:MAG: DUF1848 domain-containing protein [Methanomicrobiales archaeon]|jgi:DNA repair photolyase|nr:DUF1848 domain-containing protein [Methanomicrobiales archaeon]